MPRESAEHTTWLQLRCWRWPAACSIVFYSSRLDLVVGLVSADTPRCCLEPIRSTCRPGGVACVRPLRREFGNIVGGRACCGGRFWVVSKVAGVSASGGLWFESADRCCLTVRGGRGRQSCPMRPALGLRPDTTGRGILESESQFLVLLRFCAAKSSPRGCCRQLCSRCRRS